MVRLGALVTVVCVFAAVVGSTTVAPGLDTPICVVTNTTSTNPNIPKTKSIRICGGRAADLVIDLCRDHGGLNAVATREVAMLRAGSHGLTKCKYEPEYKRESMTCECCVYGPCSLADLYDYCLCATVQPPTEMPPWIGDM